MQIYFEKYRRQQKRTNIAIHYKSPSRSTMVAAIHLIVTKIFNVFLPQSKKYELWIWGVPTE